MRPFLFLKTMYAQGSIRAVHLWEGTGVNVWSAVR